MFINYQTLSLVLSIIGMVVLLTCLLLGFTGRATSVNQPQKIKGLGVELEVSALSLFVIVGFVLSVSSIYLQVRNYESQLAAAEAERASLAKALEQAGKVSMRLLVTLEDVETPKAFPKPEDVLVSYSLQGQGEWVKGIKVTGGLRNLELAIPISDVTYQTNIAKLELRDRGTEPERVWSSDAIGYLLSPAIQLKKQ